MRLEGGRSPGDRVRATQLGELSHQQTLVPAGVDSLEGFEVEIHVHGQAVVAGMAANADANATEFLAVYVDTGCFLASLSTNAIFGSELNHALFESGDDVADT